MSKRSAGLHDYSIGTLAVGRLRRTGAIPCLIAAMLLITGCDKSSTSAPQKTPAPEGPPQPQVQQQDPIAAASDKLNKPTKPSKASRYVNADKGFAIDFPKSWKRETDPDGIFTIMASSPQEHSLDGFSENVYVMVKDMPEIMDGGLPRQLSLNDYFDLSRANFPKIYENAVERGIGQIVVNEQICPWVICTHVYNTVNMKTIRYYLRHEQEVFIIVCTATPESFEKYSGTFLRIANSITFE